jgi:TetR/AcrR family transcriptional regulator
MTATALAAPPAPATRDLILDAAERLFAEHGFDGVSVRDLAAAAGLRNQASLYHHFSNKQAIYEATLRRGIESIVAVVSEAGRSGLLRAHAGVRAQDVGAYLDRVLDSLVEHPHLARLIQRAGLDDDPFVRSTVPGLLQPLYAQGMRVLHDAGGPWTAAELPYLAAALYHMIFGYFASAPLLQAVLGDDPRSPQSIARQRRFLRTAVTQLLGAAVSGTPDSRTVRKGPPAS